jgi:thymidine kinase
MKLYYKLKKYYKLKNMSLTVYYGPMFSGKTTRLIQLINKYPSTSSLVIKPYIDNRYSSNKIVSHGHLTVGLWDATTSTNALPIKHLNETKSLLNGPEGMPRYVFIDEGHMFGELLVPFVSIAMASGAHVFVTTIDKVFNGSEFKCIKELIELSDWAHYKQGKCNRCENKSVYSHLKNTPNATDKKSETIIVGGSELYEPLCESHFLLATHKNPPM